MRTKLIITFLGIILAIVLVSATYYPEPFSNDVDINDYDIYGADWITANYFNGTLTGTGNINMSDTNITGIDRLIFTLGEMIDNAVDGWITITGDLQVDENINASGNVTAENLISNEDIYVGSGTEWLSIYLSGSIGYINSTYPIYFLEDIGMSGYNITEVDSIIGNSNNVRIGNAGTDSHSLTANDDLFVSGKLEVDGNVWFDSALTVDGNCTCENVHLPCYVSTHTNTSITAVEGAWLNVTFDTHDDTENKRVTHTYSDATNDTFTIIDTGVYRVSYGISYLDSASSPDNIVAIRLIKDSTEIEGSVFEKDTTKQNALGTLYRNVMASLTAGDEIKLQFISNSTSVSMQTAGTYGTHPTSANLNIHRIS